MMADNGGGRNHSGLLSNGHKSVVGGLPFGYWMKSASLGHKLRQRTIISSSHNMTTCAGGQLVGRNGGSNKFNCPADNGNRINRNWVWGRTVILSGLFLVWPDWTLFKSSLLLIPPTKNKN